MSLTIQLPNLIRGFNQRFFIKKHCRHFLNRHARQYLKYSGWLLNLDRFKRGDYLLLFLGNFRELVGGNGSQIFDRLLYRVFRFLFVRSHFLLFFNSENPHNTITAHIPANINCHGFQNAPIRQTTPNVPNVEIIAFAWNLSENITSAIRSNHCNPLFFISKQIIRGAITHFANDNNPFRAYLFGRTVT